MPISSFLSASGPGRRSSRPRPLSSSGITALVGGAGHLLPRFSAVPMRNGGGELGGGGGGGIGGGRGDAGSEGETPVKYNMQHTTSLESSSNMWTDGSPSYMYTSISGDVTSEKHARRRNKKKKKKKNKGHADGEHSAAGSSPPLETSVARMESIISRVKDNQTELLSEVDKKLGVIINLLAQMVGTNATKISHVYENKGLLDFISTFTENMSKFKIILVSVSLMYPGSPKALVTYDQTEIKVLCVINASILVLDFFLTPFAAHFRGSKSTNHIGLDIFIGSMFLWWLIFTGQFCITLKFYLQINNWVLWIGIAIFIFIFFSLLAYIENQRPTIVSKCATALWKKITSCLNNSLRQGPQDIPGLPGP